MTLLETGSTSTSPYAPVGGPVWQGINEPIIIPGYTLDDQGVWHPPDDLPSSLPDPVGSVYDYLSADDRVSAEVLGLPGRLAERFKQHLTSVNSRRAHSLNDTFLGDRCHTKIN